MLTLPRAKKRHLLASIAYKAVRLVPRSMRLGLLLDLEWIANRLANEAASGSGLLLQEYRNPFLFDAIHPADKVLDLGCADGFITEQIVAGRVVGVDHDDGLICRAQKTRRGEFHVGDAREFLRCNPDFDVLVMSHVLEHIDDPNAFLAEFSPLVQRIYVEVPDFDATPLNRYRELGKRQLIYADNDHVSEFRREDIFDLAGQAGMEVAASEFRLGVMKFWLERR